MLSEHLWSQETVQRLIKIHNSINKLHLQHFSQKSVQENEPIREESCVPVLVLPLKLLFKHSVTGFLLSFVGLKLHEHPQVEQQTSPPSLHFDATAPPAASSRTRTAVTCTQKCGRNTIQSLYKPQWFVDVCLVYCHLSNGNFETT